MAPRAIRIVARKLRAMLRLAVLVGALVSSNAFMLRSGAAALSLQQGNSFEVTAHGLVKRSAKINILGDVCPDSRAEHLSTHRSTSHTPSTRRLLLDGVSRTNATDATQVALTLSAAPKRADHLASTDDPIDECVAVLANGEEPDEEMLAKCQDIAREEFANQATLEDENSY